MFTTYFSSQQILIFCLFGILQLLSIYFFSYKNNVKYAMLFLFVGGIVIRLQMILFDDFFHLWDEQFHALVAKNLAENPLKPLLFKNAPLDYKIHDWSGNHVWLHKQPLFLWQIAFSIRIFGESVFSVRLPSLIMACLLIIIIFRIGKLIINEKVGYISAFLFSVNNYLLELLTGMYHTDHNDIAFIFYITLSIWAYTEYSVQKKTNYLWLIGFFAGLAILNKWLVGLLVFSGWGIFVLFVKETTGKRIEIKNILMALMACAVVFVPWQIYIFKTFPIESQFEFSYNTRHFFEAVEGHEGDYWYHFEQAIIQYGNIVACLIPLSLFIFFRDVKNIAVRFSFLTYVLIVYLFFTLAKTKMPAFCLVVSPIIFLSLGNLLYKTMHYSINEKTIKTIQFAVLTVLGIVFLNIDGFQRNHTFWQTKNSRVFERKVMKRATEFAKSLKGKYSKNAVIVNCKKHENIPVMFFTRYTAYDRIPTTNELNSLKKNGFEILFVDNYDSSIPENILNDTDITILHKEISFSRIDLKARNNKFVYAEKGMNNMVFANKDKSEVSEYFSLLILPNNECLLRTDDNNFFSADLFQNGEIFANRNKADEWEIFTFIELDDNYVAFKAANDRYLSLDKESLRIFARGNSIGANERFELIINSN